MRFTSRNVLTLDPGEHRDSLVPGLLLRVTDTSRAWGFRYTFSGQRDRVWLGPLERDKGEEGKKIAADIERARNLARLLVAGLVRGEDPRLTLRRHDASAITVAELCRRLLEGTDAVKGADLRDETRRGWRNIFKRHIETTPFGANSAIFLSPDAIDAQCAKILTKSGGHYANRFFEVVRRAYSFGAEKRWVMASPFVGIKAPFKEKKRGRYLSEAELARLVNALDAMPPCGHVDATWLLLHTVKRRSQVETSAAKEWHLDGTAPYWLAPHEGMGSKGSPDDKVGLSTQAVKVARHMLRFRSKWLLPNGSMKSHGEISTDFLNLLRAEVGSDRPWSLHCLRATFATHAQERWRADLSLISVCLGHVPTGIPEATLDYALSARLEEKRELLQKWADWLDSLRASPQPGEMLNSREAQKFMGMSAARMSEYRSAGLGAPHKTILKRVWYRKDDLEKWLKERNAGPHAVMDKEARGRS